MKNLFAITMMVMAVAAMGPGREMGAPSRVNPPSAADVDAAQAARPDPAPNDAATPSGLHILEAANTTPEEFLWQARPVVVFADTARIGQERAAAMYRDYISMKLGAIELGEGALAAIRANLDGTGRINSPDADRF